MIKLGQYNTLRITRFTDHGAYLDGGTVGEILMPKTYVERSMRPGDEVEVFVYLDQSERLVGTLETPLARVGDFAFLKVAWVNEYGAFLDWGLMKDLFVPFREQKMPMQQGRSYLVHVHIDPETQRIVASAKVERYLQPARPTDYHRGQEVEVIVQQKHPSASRWWPTTAVRDSFTTTRYSRPNPMLAMCCRPPWLMCAPTASSTSRCNALVRDASATLPTNCCTNCNRPAADCPLPTVLPPRIFSNVSV